MMEPIYEIESLSVTTGDLVGKDYKSIYDMSIKLDTKYYDVIMFFYNKGYKSPKDVGWVDTYPEFCEITNNFRYRFLILKYNDDYLFLNIKAVTKRCSTQEDHYIVSRIISYKGSSENIRDVYKMLTTLKPFKYYVVFSDTEREGTDYWADNYYNTRESCDFLFTHKFEAKRRINKIKGIADIQVYDYCDEVLKSEVFSLLSIWEENRGPNASSDRKALVKFLDLINKKDNIHLMVERVNNKIVAYNCCFTHIGKYVVYRTAKSLGSLGMEVVKKYFDTGDEDFARIIKEASDSYCIQQMFKYYLIDNDFEAVFLEGDDHNKGLGWYKGLMTEHKTYYYKLPLSELKSTEGV